MPLTPAQLSQFRDDGYLLLSDFLPASLLKPIIQEIDATIDRYAKEAYDSGEITELHEDKDFYRRLIYLYAQSQKFYDRISVGRLNGPALFNLLVSDYLLDIAEQLVGGEILCSPTYRVRPKMPNHDQTVVPWHQDVGYIPPQCDDVFLLAYWIPLLDADATNGGMEMIPNADKGKVFSHKRERFYLAIDDPECPLERATPVSVPFGGALLLNQKTPHRSVPHSKEVVRWSLDIRYQDARLPNGNYYEAGFLARSKEHPEQVVRSPELFKQIRESHVPQPQPQRWQ